MSKFPKADLLVDNNCILGEGPIWDWRRQLLFWVDIEGKQLFKYDFSNGKQEHLAFEEMIGAVAPTETGKLLLALESDLASLDFETGQLSPHQVLQNKDPGMRFNDGKVAPNGHFWVGTMHKEQRSGAGALYRISPDFKSSRMVPDTTISNGMAWSADNKTFYYIDSEAYEIWQFDYDIDTGDITNKTIAFQVPQTYGAADGMCIDTEDMLWMAHWGGNCVRRWNPKTGQVLEKVEVDAPNVTSCCFGGRELNTLYISTAKSGLTGAQLEEFPKSGGLFSFRPGVRGTPINYFKDN